MQEKFMEIAIKIASSTEIDIPVGAVIVKDGEIISIAQNKKEQDNDITAHAEIVAIKKAEEFLHNWRLDDCELYVTLEPCPMCAWAILQSRIKSVYFGSYDTQYGAFGSNNDITQCDVDEVRSYESNKVLIGKMPCDDYTDVTSCSSIEEYPAFYNTDNSLVAYGEYCQDDTDITSCMYCTDNDSNDVDCRSLGQ